MGSILIFAALGYLFVIGVLAVAVLIVLKGGKERRPAGCGGCAIAVALLFAAALGAVGCTAVVIVGAGSEVVKHGPVRSIEFDWDEHGAWRDEDRTDPVPAPRTWRQIGRVRGEFPVRLRLELDRDVDVSSLSRWIREELDGDLSLTWEVQDGRTVLDFGLPIDPDDMRDFEAELRRELPELDLPRSVRIEIREPGDD